MKSAQLLLSGWQVLMVCPLQATDLPPLMTEIDAALKPATDNEVATILDALFAVLPYPGQDALPAWFAIAKTYPARVIARGSKALIGAHQYNVAPMPAALKALCDSDLEYVEWRDFRRRLGLVAWKLERQ